LIEHAADPRLDDAALVKWSVGIKAEGDRVMEREEIVELADAVAVHSGIATGMGQTTYGAQIIVEAVSRDEAIARGTRVFKEAVAAAGLPEFPIVFTEAITEEEDADWDGVDG
jgi:hypothetical protein